MGMIFPREDKHVEVWEVVVARVGEAESGGEPIPLIEFYL